MHNSDLVSILSQDRQLNSLNLMKLYRLCDLQKFRLRLHWIGYVQIRLGSDPLCLHRTGSELEQYGST